MQACSVEEGVAELANAGMSAEEVREFLAQPEDPSVQLSHVVFSLTTLTGDHTALVKHVVDTYFLMDTMPGIDTVLELLVNASIWNGRSIDLNPVLCAALSVDKVCVYWCVVLVNAGQGCEPHGAQ